MSPRPDDQRDSQQSPPPGASPTAGRVGRRFCLSWLVAGGLVAGAEAGCRVAFRSLDGYWQYWNPEAARKFETFRQLAADRATVPGCVVVGDSTATNNFLPSAVKVRRRPAADSRGADSPGAYNLGWPSNFARAFEVTTLPLLAAVAHLPRHVVVSFSPWALVDVPSNQRSEQAIVQSVLGRRLEGRFIVGDWLHLTRLRALRYFADSWFGGTPRPPREAGYREAEPAVVRDNSTAAATYQLAPARVAVLTRLGNLCRRRGSNLWVVLPPRADPSPQRRQLETQYRTHLSQAAAQGTLRWLDHRRLSLLTRADFADRDHLNRRGAERYSRYLAAQLDATDRNARRISRRDR